MAVTFGDLATLPESAGRTANSLNLRLLDILRALSSEMPIARAAGRMPISRERWCRSFTNSSYCALVTRLDYGSTQRERKWNACALIGWEVTLTDRPVLPLTFGNTENVAVIVFFDGKFKV